MRVTINPDKEFAKEISDKPNRLFVVKTEI